MAIPFHVGGTIGKVFAQPDLCEEGMIPELDSNGEFVLDPDTGDPECVPEP